jgi:transposase
MEDKKSYQSWTISDEFWAVIKDEIPQKERDPEKQYKHAPGQGRPPIPARKVLEGIFYVLRTGCQWKAVPKEYGCASSIHRYYQEWVQAGFFQKIWALGLEKYDELEGIGWEW